MKEIELGLITEIPSGEGRAFLIGDLEVAVFRTRKDEVFATQARCPHRNGTLVDGLLGTGKLTCPLHEWTFDLCSGEPLTGECAIDVYPIRCLDDGTLVLAWPGNGVGRHIDS